MVQEEEKNKKVLIADIYVEPTANNVGSTECFGRLILQIQK